MTTDLSERLDNYREKFVGKQIRNKNLMIIGTVANIIMKHNCRWNKDFYFAILEDGTEIDLFHYGIKE